MTANPAAAVVRPDTEDTPVQRRLAAFCSRTGAEVFHSVVSPQQVWEPDPFDVDSIHQEARETFQRLLNRATSSSALPSGRILLLLGESGSGKTHLMRAFRNFTHDNDRGYCGYLQMTSLVSNYARYVLSKLLDALDQPYRQPDVPTSGLTRLALGLLEAVPDVSPEERAQFREGPVTDLGALVEDYADRLLADPRFEPGDLGVIRALLYLQRDDPRIKARVLSYLRCEDLSPGDRALVAGLMPRPQEEEPLRMICQLGRLMGAVHGLPLVLCVDQLEDMTDQEAAPERFRRAMSTLVTVAENVPASVVVIACLEDYFVLNRGHLPKPKLDRLESDPEPVRLRSQRSLEEIETLVARRLEYLYDEQAVSPDAATPTFPFTRKDLEPLTNLRTRDVLDFCRRHHDRCRDLQRYVPPGPTPPPPPPPPLPETLTTEQAWNDFLVKFQGRVPDDEPELATLLRWAIGHCSDELPEGHWFSAEEEDGRMIPVEAHGPGNAVSRLLVAVCDRQAQGNGLSRQVTEVEKRAGETPVVIVRSTAFPARSSTKIAKQIAELLKHNGRRVVIENTDWRKMLALQAFHDERGKTPTYEAWVRETRPLCQLPSLRQVLALDALLKHAAASPPATAATPPPPRPAAAKPDAPPPDGPVPDTGPLPLGVTRGLTAAAVTIDPEDLKQHAAFLGASGSGKTTAALTLIEQLLARSIPAVMLDRKGDLCRYADPSAWQRPLADPRDVARRQRLRDRLDVAVFTPGQAEGQPLTIPIVPDGMDSLPTLEREQLAGYAAAALGGMIGYKPRGADQSRQAVLAKAIEVLSTMPGTAVTLPALRQLVADRDPALLSAVGGFDDRVYKKLADELLTLWHGRKSLLAGEADRLDIDVLLGRHGHAPAGKTRLSVISTQFLGDAATVEFWVAQLLLAIDRWRTKNASPQLQAVFLFDEADLYLPAQRQPATKAPMEGLLKRARSAGVGLMLATQSPGDFDYKCRDNIRTWLVGRVTQTTALNKLRPMFAEARVDVAAKLPAQETGQFYLVREKVALPVQAAPSLIATEQLPEERILALARANRT